MLGMLHALTGVSNDRHEQGGDLLHGKAVGVEMFRSDCSEPAGCCKCPASSLEGVPWTLDHYAELTVARDGRGSKFSPPEKPQVLGRSIYRGKLVPFTGASYFGYPFGCGSKTGAKMEPWQVDQNSSGLPLLLSSEPRPFLPHLQLTSSARRREARSCGRRWSCGASTARRCRSSRGARDVTGGPGKDAGSMGALELHEEVFGRF